MCCESMSLVFVAECDAIPFSTVNAHFFPSILRHTIAHVNVLFPCWNAGMLECWNAGMLMVFMHHHKASSSKHRRVGARSIGWRLADDDSTSLSTVRVSCRSLAASQLWLPGGELAVVAVCPPSVISGCDRALAPRARRDMSTSIHPFTRNISPRNRKNLCTTCSEVMCNS
jgi:hypothetical protein